MLPGGPLAALSVSDLLGSYADILDELRHRGVVRSSNNPIGDYAETLFCDCFGWRREKASVAGYDAVDRDGLKVQIKSRRVTGKNGSRQLSALRRLDQNPFDILAGVLLDVRFQVLKAALIPIATVRKGARYDGHTNGWLFFLDDGVWDLDGVVNATAALRTACEAGTR